MYITKAHRKYQRADGQWELKHYYLLMRSIRTPGGRVRKRSVLCLGALEHFTTDHLKELAHLLTVMIDHGVMALSEHEHVRDKALEFYSLYRQKYSSCAVEEESKLKEARERFDRERQSEQIAVKLETLIQKDARCVGPEAICQATLNNLHIRKCLMGLGWSRFEIDLAMLQICARAIYPFSELKTVRYLRENSALSELFHISPKRITKDLLYQSSLRLWAYHSQIEDWLHNRVCNMFSLNEKILLFDITNTYFEGAMDLSEICKRGRSKEKRNDCKIVVLAAVVNTEGLLVRTKIFAGNRSDVTTVAEVISSLDCFDLVDGKKRIVVMDAGFYSLKNIQWLTEHGYDYIIVKPAGERRFKPSSNQVPTIKDSKGQLIHLQAGTVEVEDSTTGKTQTLNAVLVNSDTKTLKEYSMYQQASVRYEEGLKAIAESLTKKRGVKERDAVNKRIGKLNKKYGAIRKIFDVHAAYKKQGKKQIVTALHWERNKELEDRLRSLHGKYVLLTSLDSEKEENVWQFYNVIRTVEETFHVLKTDIDIRPVYHKSDIAIMAHINLAILAYWVVSVTKYQLKINNYPNFRWDEIMRIASTQVCVTAQVETGSGEKISIRQTTEPEEKLATIYQLLHINPHPLGKRKAVDIKNPSQKKAPPD